MTTPTIMLVEEDAQAVELVQSACAQCDPPLQLQVVPDSQQAMIELIRTLAEGRPLPHFILLDLKLPKLLGLAVLRHLRMDARFLDLPIIAYSRDYQPQEVVLAYKAGVNSFVPKPQDDREFYALLVDLVSYWVQPRQRKLALDE